MHRWLTVANPKGGPLGIELCAQLASRLSRLAKGCQRASVGECNGTLRDQRYYTPPELRSKEADEATAYAARIDKQVSKLSKELAPLGLWCKRNGDPRGFSLCVLGFADGTPVPSNGTEANVWGIE
jgi:hypothetical protein